MSRKTRISLSVSALSLMFASIVGCASQNPCGPYQSYPAYPYPQQQYAPYAPQPGMNNGAVMPPTYGAPIAQPGVGNYPPGYNGMPVAYPPNNGVKPLIGS